MTSNPNNPLSPEQITALKQAQNALVDLERRIKDARQAGVPLPADIEETHKTLAKRVQDLLLVYGGRR